ncbi:MAG: Putative metal ABC transport system ATP-binding protein [Clostridiales bacterium 38_11]|nr:MAG: Putative metal ABC transport system ATP-binding protein [Clostridiales bacterium 38_11]HBH12068.1 ABC transporter [Clostridiales bacterium]
MEKLIEVKDLSFEINGKTIVDHHSFTINKGEFVSIIGPNGAGKTSLMRCLSNNLRFEGEVRLKDKSIKDYGMKEKARIIGVVPQEYSLPFNFRVHDLVKMGRNPYLKRNQNLGRADSDIIIKAMQRTNTYAYKNRFYNSLSGGEKQRVITARVLTQEPEILFLDEFTSNLDIHNQLEIIELIYEMNRLKGITVLSIMHDLNMASRFSDRILLMIDGKIEIFDTPENVLKEEILSKAYKMEMIIRDNKVLNCKEIVPLRVKNDELRKNKRIHVISGGGTGEYILEKLYAMGYELSCGILAEGDSDLTICRSLGIDCVYESPFSVFGAETITENETRIKNADIILMTDVPFGRNNLVNLKSIENIDDRKIFILHSVNRDHVHGEADRIVDKMKNKDNVIEAMNLGELFNYF